jgi:hypothetical protein
MYIYVVPIILGRRKEENILNNCKKVMEHFASTA